MFRVFRIDVQSKAYTHKYLHSKGVAAVYRHKVYACSLCILENGEMSIGAVGYGATKEESVFSARNLYKLQKQLGSLDEYAGT